LVCGGTIPVFSLLWFAVAPVTCGENHAIRKGQESQKWEFEPGQPPQVFVPKRSYEKNNNGGKEERGGQTIGRKKKGAKRPTLPKLWAAPHG